MKQMECSKYFVKEKLNAYSIKYIFFFENEPSYFDYYIKYTITKVNNIYLQYNIYVK